MKITGVQCYLIHARQDEVRTTGFVHISFGLFVHERKKKSLNSKIPSRKYRPLQSFENNLPGAHRQGVHGPSCWIRNVFLSFLLSTELFWASSITHAPYEHLTKIYIKKRTTLTNLFIRFIFLIIFLLLYNVFCQILLQSLYYRYFVRFIHAF